VRCARCVNGATSDLHLRWGFRYQPPLDRVIRGLKGGRLQPLGERLGLRLWRLRGWNIQRPVDAVVAVPSTWWQSLQRGFNPAEEIARPIAAALGVPLLRLRQPFFRRPQKAQDRAGRLRHLQRDLGFGERSQMTGRSLLLVDDVVTTGATLQALTRTMLRAGARHVQALAACRTPEVGESSENDARTTV
jgi:predicted amidophosphoribosyltransferase